MRATVCASAGARGKAGGPKAMPGRNLLSLNRSGSGVLASLYQVGSHLGVTVAVTPDFDQIFDVASHLRRDGRVHFRRGISAFRAPWHPSIVAQFYPN